MNVKDWIVDFLNKEREILISRIAEHKAIRMDYTIDEAERNIRLDIFNHSMATEAMAFIANKDADFIKPRADVMMDITCTPDFYPGTVKAKKYAANRDILRQIEADFITYKQMTIFNAHAKLAKLAKLDEVITLADQLEHEYCWSHYGG